MAFTTESIEAPRSPTTNPLEQNQFDLPVKEFIGYDPKGTMSITGSPIERKAPENAPQPATTEEPAAPAESVRLAPQLSALARKEAAQRQRDRAFQAEKQTFAEKLAKADKYDQLQAKLKAKDFSAVEEEGLKYDEYAEYLLNKQAGEKPEEQRFRKQQEEIEALKKAREDDTVKEYQANQNLWKSEISKLVSENADFSTVKELAAEALVLQHINDSFDEDGIELTAEQGAKDIEDALVERAEKFASVTKIKNRSEAKVLGPPKTSAKTITQNMTTTSQKPASKPFHLLSESEQIAEAIRRVNAAKQAR